MALEQEYEPQFVDFETLEDLGRSINNARKAYFNLSKKFDKASRAYLSKEFIYSQAVRRSMVESKAGSVAAKKLEAEIENEHLELDMMKSKIVLDETRRALDLIRLELQTLQTVSNNVRQQLRL